MVEQWNRGGTVKQRRNVQNHSCVLLDPHFNHFFLPGSVCMWFEVFITVSAPNETIVNMNVHNHRNVPQWVGGSPLRSHQEWKINVFISSRNISGSMIADKVHQIRWI